MQISTIVDSTKAPDWLAPTSLLAARGQMGSPQWEKVMDFLDDPASRFSPGSAGNFSIPSIPDFSETEFLRRQVATIEAYLERFPSDERDLHALAWIEANASQYRHQWQTQAAAGRPLPAEPPCWVHPASSTRV